MERDERGAGVYIGVVVGGVSLFFASFLYAEASHLDDSNRYDFADDGIEEYVDWFRSRSSSVRRTFDQLDDEPVEDLHIPVLFGVARDDIYPNFGDPRGGGTRTHEGEDILAPLGTPVVSPTEAVVVRTGRGSSAGNYVYTANPGGETFVYMHLDEIADIDEGAVVDEGELIGYVGDTGNTNGVSHLHLEIRKDGPQDPYPRITKEYTLEEKTKFLEDILDEVRNEDELAEFLVETFGGVFLAAKENDIDLPREIEDALDDSDLDATLSSVTRDLTVGDAGDDVVSLQSFLIMANSGSAAARLVAAGATGYFGSITEAALAEYQEVVGIEPPDGYYGPVTHEHLLRIQKTEEVTASDGEPDSGPSTELGATIATLLTSDLSRGGESDLVKILQYYLMIENAGPAARNLFAVGATGYFGMLTEAAFTEYQRAHGIPASGMYDSATRVYMLNSE